MEEQNWRHVPLDPVLIQQGLFSLEELNMADSNSIIYGTDGHLLATNKRKRVANKKKENEGPTKKRKTLLTQQKIIEKSDTPSSEQEEGKPKEERDMSAWAPCKLHPLLLKALQDLKFYEPTPVQLKAIPAALTGRKDIFGAAETGSGKTLAYGLPILHKLLKEREKKNPAVPPENGIEALIITPTRELAIQVTDHLKAVARYTSLKIATIIGGLAPQKQRRLLSRQPQILIATPGRLWELLNEVGSSLKDLSALRFVVIDEADRLIEGGHFPEVKSIFGIINAPPPVDDNTDDMDATEGQEDKTSDSSHNENTNGKLGKKKKKKASPKPVTLITERQTFIFSATLTVPVAARDNAKRGPRTSKKKSTLDYLKKLIASGRQKVIIDLTTQQVVARAIQETQIHCLTEEKDYYLYYFCTKHPGRTLVFVNSIDCIRRLKPIMELLGLPSWGLHAELQQKQRLKNLERFKSAKNGLLIATDVAARGLDIAGVDHVVHYQLPRTAELYVHRSGRTARGGSRSGLSVMLVGPEDKICYAKICKVLHGGALVIGKDMEGFVVEMEYMPQVAKRVNLARKLDKLLHAHRKEKTERDWILSNAEAMDLEVDDDLLSSEDEETVHKKKDREKQIEGMQAQLKGLLQQPLLPKGVSTRYFTKTRALPDLLAKMAKPNREPAQEKATQTVKKKSKHVKGRKRKGRR